jgi:HEAT repeat protein
MTSDHPSQHSVFREFHSAVTMLRKWADLVPQEERVGEWECVYPDWERVYATWESLLQHSAIEAWQLEMVEDAMFAVARDNENMVMIGMVGRRGGRSLATLTNLTARYGEPETQYQCAIALARWASKQDAEPLLRSFTESPHTYVRQTAMLSLARIGSALLEDLALQQWMNPTTEATEKATLLDCLAIARSSILERLLTESELSGVMSLAEHAKELRAFMVEHPGGSVI